MPGQSEVGITKACFYEPAVNRTYAEMTARYGTAVVPARPRDPLSHREAAPSSLLRAPVWRDILDFDGNDVTAPAACCRWRGSTWPRPGHVPRPAAWCGSTRHASGAAEAWLRSTCLCSKVSALAYWEHDRFVVLHGVVLESGEQRQRVTRGIAADFASDRSEACH